jgi:4-amino-4-deoxy-L-arabinose transferase-like glycosyltransferase
MPDIIKIVALVLFIFVLAAFYYALRHPNGPVFPVRRSDLLKKIGPLATGTLQKISVRFLTRAGGIERILLQATYAYTVKDDTFTISLPTDSIKIRAPHIQRAITSREFEREVPESLELVDGTVLPDRASIEHYYLEHVREQLGEVEVLYAKKQPTLSTVRDWA